MNDILFDRNICYHIKISHWKLQKNRTKSWYAVRMNQTINKSAPIWPYGTYCLQGRVFLNNPPSIFIYFFCIYIWTFVFNQLLTLSFSHYLSPGSFFFFSPVDWDCRIQRLHLWRRGKILSTNVLHGTIWWWGSSLRALGSVGVPLHCHCFQVHCVP